jgi:hypothetical protein
MYTTSLNIGLNDFVRDSQRINVVISGREFYVSLRDGISDILATFLLVLALPSAWIFVYYFRNRLEKRIPKGIRLSVDNYAEVRKAYDTLYNIVDDLKKFQNADIQLVRFWLRGFIKEIQRLAAVLCQAMDSMKSALDKVNHDFPKSNKEVFQPISDDVLWANRPKAYQYRL